MHKKLAWLALPLLIMSLLIFTHSHITAIAVNDINSIPNIELTEIDSELYSAESSFSVAEKEYMPVSQVTVETNKMEDILENAESVSEKENKRENEDPVVYGGTLTGYLTGTGDYVAYPADLNAGNYLQVRLTLPSDSNLDYDLYLLDSSFSVITYSLYYTVTSNEMPQTIAESVGYIASGTETVYVYIESSQGGSSTLPYTLDYTITTYVTDTGETDENASYATALTLGTNGATVTRSLNSPIDNDWYSFVVIDSPEYNKMRFEISSSSNDNGCQLEIYENVVSNGYGMLRRAATTAGEYSMDPGTYYVRVVSTNTMSNFDDTDIPTYNLSVVQVARVDEVVIEGFRGPLPGNTYFAEGGPFKKVDELNGTCEVWFNGRAYYKDTANLRHPSTNARLRYIINDPAWQDITPSWVNIIGYMTVNSNAEWGIDSDFLHPAVGDHEYTTQYTTHFYDYMHLTVQDATGGNASDTIPFYYEKYVY